MQQIIPFTPSLDAPFQFDAVLDGVTYQATITQLQGAMWMELAQYGQDPLFRKPVMRSPDSADINLVDGYGITSIFIYREASNCFEIDSTRVRKSISTISSNTEEIVYTMIVDSANSLNITLLDDLSSSVIVLDPI